MFSVVTGAFGFVGRHLLAHLTSEGDKVVGSYLEQPPDKTDYKAEKLDVCDLAECRAFFSRYTPEVVYHLAAIAFVPDAERDFQQALLVNVAGTYNVLRAAMEANSNVRFLLVSSSEIFGRVKPEQLPITEETLPAPTHNYGASKVMAETICNRFACNVPNNIVIVRSFNSIGPGQRPDFAIPSFARQIFEISQGKKEPILNVGNIKVKRDFIDVRDMVRAFRLAGRRGSGVYNICSGKSTSLTDILDILIRMA